MHLAPNHFGEPKSFNNVASTFFNAVLLLPEELRFKHGALNFVSCPGRHLISERFRVHLSSMLFSRKHGRS